MSEGIKQKKLILKAEHAINWYYGNYLMNPNNALRDAEDYPMKAHNRLEALKAELSGRMMTYKQLLDFVKKNGIHAEFYRFQKPEPSDCPACRALGIKNRY